MSEDSLIFDDLQPIQKTVKVGETNYILKEASAATAAQYRSACVRAARMQDGKVVGMEGIGEVEPLLVSLCLFETNKEGQIFRSVPITTVKSWRARIVKILFEKAKEISELDEKETEEILTKRLTEIQKKLDDFRAAKEADAQGAKEAEDSAKND
jgi:hypothetical protein